MIHKKGSAIRFTFITTCIVHAHAHSQLQLSFQVCNAGRDDVWKSQEECDSITEKKLDIAEHDTRNVGGNSSKWSTKTWASPREPFFSGPVGQRPARMLLMVDVPPARERRESPSVCVVTRLRLLRTVVGCSMSVCCEGGCPSWFYGVLHCL